MGTEKPEEVNINNTINAIHKNIFFSTNPYPNKENDNYLIANFKQQAQQYVLFLIYIGQMEKFFLQIKP